MRRRFDPPKRLLEGTKQIGIILELRELVAPPADALGIKAVVLPPDDAVDVDKRDIDGHACTRADEGHAMGQRKFSGVGSSGHEAPKQRIENLTLLAVSSDDRNY